MDITENNKLIAEFMELDTAVNDRFIINPMTKYGCWEIMKYHSDWNWLMQVVEKIESLDYSINISSSMVYINGDKGIIINPINIGFNTTKIESVYNACVEFIKWYNRQ